MSVRDEVGRAGSAARAAHPGLGDRRRTRPSPAALARDGPTGSAPAPTRCSRRTRSTSRRPRARMAPALVDRLRLDAERLGRMSDQIAALAALDDIEELVGSRELPDGLVMRERRRPVGVIGANYEARPNVTVDVASQLIKSRNAGVLRTGAAALRSAIALRDEVIAPAMEAAGLDPDGDPARALARPRGGAGAGVAAAPDPAGRSCAAAARRPSSLAREAAAHGVRTLAHAEGGGVLYIDRSADRRAGAGAGGAQPRPARCLQPAQPAADRRGGLGRGAARGARRCSSAWASAPACRRTPTRSATSGRSTTATRPR